MKIYFPTKGIHHYSDKELADKLLLQLLSLLHYIITVIITITITIIIIIVIFIINIIIIMSYSLWNLYIAVLHETSCLIENKLRVLRVAMGKTLTLIDIGGFQYDVIVYILPH